VILWGVLSTESRWEGLHLEIIMNQLLFLVNREAVMIGRTHDQIQGLASKPQDLRILNTAN
jgi:hypothetical protein